MNLGGSGQEILNAAISAADLALNVANGKVYFADYSGNTINRANLDGTGVEILFNTNDGIATPSAIAIDSTNDLV